MTLVKQLFLTLGPDEWQAIFAGLSFLTVLVGTILAIRNLQVIRRTHELEAFNMFVKELEASKEDRRFVYFYHFPDHLDDIPADDFRRIENTVNFINRIGLLVEQDILPPKFVFGMTHTVIIRLAFKLKKFLRLQEQRIGGRYGRRLLRIEKRAKLYHDVRPQHRRTIIKLYSGEEGESLVVYETEFKNGWAGVIQRICWFVRDLFNLY